MELYKLIEKWNQIPKEHTNYKGVDVVGEKEMLKHFTIEELNIAEKNGWLYNNHAEYDMAEPSYNLVVIPSLQTSLIPVVSKRYRDMEFAWISSAARLYPNFVNVELEKERFKTWFTDENAQNYIQNT